MGDVVAPIFSSDKCPALMPAVHLNWIRSKVDVSYHKVAGILMLLGRCGDFYKMNDTDHNSEHDSRTCQVVRCPACPGALYRVMSMGDESEGITWGDTDLP